MARSTSAVVDRPMVDLEATTMPVRKDPDISRLRTWVNVLDRFVDPLLGLLVPGLGDALGTVLGAGVVSTAVKRKLPPIVIARMLLNLALDAVIGAVPLLGDVFDFAYQANRKNLDLLVARHETRRSTPRDWAIVGVALVVMLGAVIGALYVTYRVGAYICTHL
jgi:hypothetical protein